MPMNCLSVFDHFVGLALKRFWDPVIFDLTLPPFLNSKKAQNTHTHTHTHKDTHKPIMRPLLKEQTTYPKYTSIALIHSSSFCQVGAPCKVMDYLWTIVRGCPCDNSDMITVIKWQLKKDHSQNETSYKQ